MNIKLSILALSLLLTVNLFSQENTTESNLEQTNTLETYAKIDLGFSGLGFSVETPINHRIILEAAAGLGAGYRIDEDFIYRFYFEDPAFFASAHGKFYYNQEKRVRKGKSLSLNSGNFFGIKVKYASPTLRKDKTWHSLLTGFHWGLQRKLGNHFLYQLDIGIGAAFDIDSQTRTQMTLFPDFNFRISYVLPFNFK